jgi:hypothetical protein
MTHLCTGMSHLYTYYPHRHASNIGVLSIAEIYVLLLILPPPLYIEIIRNPVKRNGNCLSVARSVVGIAYDHNLS